MTAVAARTETAEQRRAIYAALTRRNRLVAILRIGLPAIAAVLLAVLLVQLYIASLVPDFSFANVTIDRDNLTVDAPSYSGVGSDGSIYSVSAASARAALGNTDLINMTGASLSLTQPSGTSFDAVADSAQLRVSEQVVSVAGVTRVTSNNGLSGTVSDAVIDVPGERLHATGGADLDFAGGATIRADTMSYEGKTQVWTFKNATVDFASTPGEAEYGLRPALDVSSGDGTEP